MTDHNHSGLRSPGDHFAEVVDALWKHYGDRGPQAALNLVQAKYLAASYPVTIHALNHMRPEAVAEHLFTLDAGSTGRYLDSALRQHKLAKHP